MINKMIKTYNEYLNEGVFEIDKVKPYEKLLITAIVDFMEDTYDFNAKIIIIKRKTSSKFIGDIVLTKKAIDDNKFTLHFNPEQSMVFIIKSIIHELTHIKQAVKYELCVSDDLNNIVWKNDFVISVRKYNSTMKDINEYIKLPWENEAYRNMDELYDKFINSEFYKSLSGKDTTLDFIINEL